jgi:hypothetical protein
MTSSPCRLTALSRAKPKPVRCFAHLCPNLRPPWHYFCEACFERLPRELRVALARERERCRAARIFHTQELFALRDRAYAELKAKRQS